MKKMMMMLAGVLFVATGAFAQKQFAGAKTLEVDFTPLGGSPIQLNQIKFRSFSTETTALRLGVFLGLESSTDVTMQAGDIELPVSSGSDNDEANPILTDKNSEFTVSVRPGYEMHFPGTERLSPYVGGEALISFTSMKKVSESWGYSSIVGSGDDVGEVSGLETWETTTNDGSLTFGLNAIAGCDFYFSNSIYMGFEFGFGFAATSISDTKTEFSNVDAYSLANEMVEFDTDDEGNTTASLTGTQPDPLENGKSFNLGPNVNGGIRLGFAF